MFTCRSTRGLLEGHSHRRIRTKRVLSRLGGDEICTSWLHGRRGHGRHGAGAAIVTLSRRLRLQFDLDWNC
jgi:hypothetical protein